ncbi:MAG: transposase [Armatimonadota bacterium]|nr:transposase [Armatimonadota bacterium]
MSRPPRPVFAGAIYHITARGNNGGALFADDTDRYRYLTLLAAALRRADACVLAYVLMTTHVHLVLQTRQPNVSPLMQWLHTRHARQFNRRHGRMHHLFGDRFGSRLITDDAYLVEVTIYVHLNPVRAGMVGHPGDYPWSSYPAYAGGGPHLADPRRVLELLGPDLRAARRAYLLRVVDALARDRDEARPPGRVSPTGSPTAAGGPR